MPYCTHIRHFSSDVYNFLSEVFSYGLGFAELGMTDHLVLHLARHARFTGDNSVEIYKLSWNVESIYGNDLDLFVENTSGHFNWYSLQAKIMSSNGSFRDIKNKPHGQQQWDKLLFHETEFGSKTFYLLYSGEPFINKPTVSPNRIDCIGIPDIKELGLGIVETQIIKNLRMNVLTQYGLLYFNHVYPNDIDSLRKLICCRNTLPKTSREFKREEIETDDYQQIYFKKQETENLNKEEDQSQIIKNEKGASKYRLIIKSDANNGLET